MFKYLMTENLVGIDYLLKARLYSFITPDIHRCIELKKKQNLMQEIQHSYGITVTKLSYSEIFL